jgi:hypothetical protein
MALRTNNLALKHWMNLHPYKNPSATDSYYFKICRNVRRLIDFRVNKELADFLETDEKNIFSCYLTSYFEDVITETGLWRAFISEHKKLYDKYLPFYSPEEYFVNEINPEDVYFLVWYYLSSTHEDLIISPDAYIILNFGDQVYDLFDEVYEYAPENERLKEFFNISEDDIDYYFLRSKIEWLVMDSYLFHFNRVAYKNEIIEMYESKEDEPNVLEIYCREINDSYTIKHVTSLLGLRGSEWFAEVLGSKHPLYNDFKTISKRKTGFFLYKGHDDDFLHLQYIATDKIIPVTRKSIDPLSDLKADDTIFLISLVQWQKEWWFSGTYTTFPYNADLIMDEKNSSVKRKLFNENDELQVKTLQEQYDGFLSFNNNKPIAFFSNGSKMVKYLDKFIEYWNNSLKLTIKERQEALRRSRQKGFLRAEKDPSMKTDQFPDSPGLVFFNKKSGMEMLFGYNEIVSSPDNSDFDADIDPSEIINLFTSNQCSGDLAHYLIETYNWPPISFPGEVNTQILKENLDFMLRFWKKEKYSSEPNITAI